jgi:hypothetical protein
MRAKSAAICELNDIHGHTYVFQREMIDGFYFTNDEPPKASAEVAKMVAISAAQLALLEAAQKKESEGDGWRSG